jgi:F-actin capping protein alpha subunit
MSSTAPEVIIQELVKSAPAGKLDALLDDIQKLLRSSSLSIDQEVLQQIKSRHEQDTCCSSTTSASASSQSHHPLALLLKQGMEEKYHASSLNTRSSSTGERVVVVARGVALAPGTTKEDDNDILLRTYAECVEEENSRTGFWSAEWTIRAAASHDVTTTTTTMAEVSGIVQLGSYSFDHGNNYQLRSTQTFPMMQLQQGDTNNLVSVILEQIVSWEQQVLVSLKTSCAQSSLSLKSLRGILPITHQRLNWNVVAHRTVRTLQDTVTK